MSPPREVGGAGVRGVGGVLMSPALPASGGFMKHTHTHVDMRSGQQNSDGSHVVLHEFEQPLDQRVATSATMIENSTIHTQLDARSGQQQNEDRSNALYLDQDVAASAMLLENSIHELRVGGVGSAGGVVSQLERQDDHRPTQLL